MKKFWLPIFLVSFIVLLTGCSSRTRNVSTYDEEIERVQRERYNELDAMLFEKYDTVSEMTQDPLYQEYTGLSIRFRPGSSYAYHGQDLRNNITASVNLSNQTVHYNDIEIPFEIKSDQVVIPNNPTELQNETLIRMVELADSQHKKAVASNQSVLFSTAWLPIVMIVVGVIGFVSPESIWYLEGGYRNKNAEPSDLAIVMVKIQSIILFIIAVVLTWMIYQSLV